MATPAGGLPPSTDIALCFSGGGYRAAAYHLGTLTMLSELGMLDRVKYFSTASGGTIVAVAFVLSRVEGQSFGEFSEGFQQFLLENNVVKKALGVITATRFDSQKKDLSLIRAAAGIYEAGLTKGKTIKDLKSGAIETKKFVDLIFNATDFRSGNGFRFRVCDGASRAFGNGIFNVTDTDLQDAIKLSDVVAASSCFPGAFEPIRFPEDFDLPDGVRLDLPFGVRADGCRSLPLMDGGIFDNQGIKVFIEGYDGGELPFDFALVSDTTPIAETILDYKIAERVDGISVNGAFQAAICCLALVFFSSFILIGFALANIGNVSLFQFAATQLAAVFSMLVSGALLLLLAFARFRLGSLEVLGTRFPIWRLISELRIADLVSLVSTRLASAQALLFNVFMKRIRDLNNESVKESIDKTSRANLLFGKNTYSLIYDIEKGDAIATMRKRDPEIDVNRRMVRLSKAAGRVPTALWLNQDQLESLIECGRITACHALIRLVWEKWQRANKDAQVPGLVPKSQSKILELVKKPTDPDSPFHDEYMRLKKKWLELKKETVPDVLLP